MAIRGKMIRKAVAKSMYNSDEKKYDKSDKPKKKVSAEDVDRMIEEKDVRFTEALAKKKEDAIATRMAQGKGVAPDGKMTEEQDKEAKMKAEEHKKKTGEYPTGKGTAGREASEEDIEKSRSKYRTGVY